MDTLYITSYGIPYLAGNGGVGPVACRPPVAPVGSHAGDSNPEGREDGEDPRDRAEDIREAYIVPLLDTNLSKKGGTY